jgi:hypothetical protein
MVLGPAALLLLSNPEFAAFPQFHVAVQAGKSGVIGHRQPKPTPARIAAEPQSPIMRPNSNTNSRAVERGKTPSPGYLARTLGAFRACEWPDRALGELTYNLVSQEVECKSAQLRHILKIQKQFMSQRNDRALAPGPSSLLSFPGGTRPKVLRRRQRILAHWLIRKRTACRCLQGPPC